MPDLLDPLIEQMGHALSLSSNAELARSYAAEAHEAAAREAHPAMFEVFRTTELLEVILSFLPTKDVLAAETCSRRLRAVVAASPLLRLHKFVHPQYHRHFQHFQLLPLNFPGLDIEKGDAIAMGHWIRITLRPLHSSWRKYISMKPVDSDYPPRPSTTAGLESVDHAPLSHAELLVLQPPLKGMQSSEGVIKLFCETGITLGHLHEAAVKVVRKKRPRSAGSSSATVHREDEAVTFTAIVSFTMPKVPDKAKIKKPSMIM